MNFLPSHESVFWFDCSPVFKLDSILVALLITGVGRLFHWLVNHILKHLQWNLDITKNQGTGKFVHDNEVSLYRGSFSSILLYSDWGNENRTLYQRLRYTEAPLYLDVGKRRGYLPQ